MRLFLANFTHCAVQTGHFLPSSKGSLKKIGDLVIAKDFVLVKISLFKKQVGTPTKLERGFNKQVALMMGGRSGGFQM